MPVVQANGLDIHYRVNGARRKRVLIDGIGDDLEGWGAKRGDFAAAGLRVVTFDNRGCGGSSHPPGPYTSQQMAADTKGLVNALGLAPLHLCGVSMGGVIAQEYAIAYPGDLRSVVLANTYAAADPLTHAAFESWALVAEAAGMPVMMQQQAPWVFSTAFYAQQPGKLAGFLAEMDDTTHGHLLRGADRRADQPRRHRAARLGHHAGAGHRLPGRHRHQAALSHRLHEALPGSAWQLLPGGHATFLENPVLWNATVLGFIDAHRAHPRPVGGGAPPP